MRKRKCDTIASDEEELSEGIEVSDSDGNEASEDDDSDVRVRGDTHQVRGQMNSMDDDALFGFFKKFVCSGIRQIVSDAGASSSGRTRKRRDHASVPSPQNNSVDIAGGSKTVTRLSVSYFSDLIENLGESKKNVIRDYGFGSLLMFDRCYIPLPFARWIADHVKINTADIVVNNRSIQLSPESVHDVLHIPIGGTPIKKDTLTGKNAFLKLLKQSTLPKIKYFGDKLSEDGIDDDELVRCFLVVALAVFLCPSSSTIVSPDYLAPLIDVKKAKEWNWALLVFEWLLKKIKQYQKLAKKAAHSSITLGGCMYYLCVVYLDHLDFAQRTVPPPIIPRINVWKGDLIKVFSELDCKGGHIFGERPVKDFQSTCYYKISSAAPADSACPGPSSVNAESFKLVLDQTVAGSFSPKVLQEIVDIYVRNASVVNVNQPEHVQKVMLDVIKYFYDISRREDSYETSQQGVHVNGSVPEYQNDVNGSVPDSQNDGNIRNGSHQVGDDYGDEGYHNAYASGYMDCDENISAAGGQGAEADCGGTNNNVSKEHIGAPVNDEATLLDNNVNCSKDQLADQRTTTSTAETEILPSTGTGSDVRASKSGDTVVVTTNSLEADNHLRPSQGGSTTHRKTVRSKCASLSQHSDNSVASRTRLRRMSTISPISPCVDSQFKMVDNPEGILKRRNRKKLSHRSKKSLPSSSDEVHAVSDDSNDDNVNVGDISESARLTREHKSQPIENVIQDKACPSSVANNSQVPFTPNPVTPIREQPSGVKSASFDHLLSHDISSHKSRDMKSTLGPSLVNHDDVSPESAKRRRVGVPCDGKRVYYDNDIPWPFGTNYKVFNSTSEPFCYTEREPSDGQDSSSCAKPSSSCKANPHVANNESDKASDDRLNVEDNDTQLEKRGLNQRCSTNEEVGNQAVQHVSTEPLPPPEVKIHSNEQDRNNSPEPIPLAAVHSEGKYVVINSQDSPDVTVIGHTQFSSRTGLITNSPNVSSIGGLTAGNEMSFNSPEVVITGRSDFQSALSKMSQMVNAMHDEAHATNFQLCQKVNFDLGSTSEGKMPRRRARRLQHPNSFYRDFKTNECNVRWSHTRNERMIYESLLHYANDALQSKKNIIDYGNVTVNLKDFAESMKRDATSSVHPFVINAFCYKLFKDRHPNESQKHYFFSTVGDYLMDHQYYNPKRLHDMAERSFKYAHNIRDLRSADMLYFPIYHYEHWFLFVVDIRDGFFVFMDCFFRENDKYQTNVRNTLIPNFVKAWDEFVKEPYDFHKFSLHYVDVPMQSFKNHFRKADDGIFTLKFIELWDPCVNMMTRFTGSHIADMRISYVSDMVMSRHNKLQDMKKLLEDYEAVQRAKQSKSQDLSMFGL